MHRWSKNCQGFTLFNTLEKHLRKFTKKKDHDRCLTQQYAHGSSCTRKRQLKVQVASKSAGSVHFIQASSAQITYQWLLRRDMWMSASLSKAPQMPVFRETSTHLALDSKIKIFAGLRMVLRGCLYPCQSMPICQTLS